MAANKPDIDITKQDRALAARENRDALVHKISRSKPGALADLLLKNFDTFEKMLPAGVDLDGVVDTLRGGDKKRQKIAKSFLAGSVRKLKNSRIESVDFKQFGIKEKSAADFSFKREREAVQKQKRKDNLFAAVISVGKFLTTSSTASFTIGKHLAQSFATGIEPVGHLLMAGGHVARAYPKPAAIALTAALATAAGYGLPHTDSAPYLSMINPDYAAAFKKACTPDVLKNKSILNAHYAIKFEPDGKNAKAQHAYHTMMSGARHGVPAIGLHVISYFETIGFTDMLANKSSASNPFQFLNETKLVYLKRYGTKTYQYQEASERIKSGLNTPADNLLVSAVEAVRDTDESVLRQMSKSKKMPGAIYDAFRIADTSSMASELIALDIINKNPDIRSASAEDVLDTITAYYAEHHFLGMGNYAFLNKVAQKYPQMPLTDMEQVAKHLGDKDAKKIAEIATDNPIFFKKDITAPQVLNAIKQKFIEFVKPEYNKFMAGFVPEKSVTHACLINENQKDIPETIARYQIISLKASATYQAYMPDAIKGVFMQASHMPQATIKESQPAAEKNTGAKADPVPPRAIKSKIRNVSDVKDIPLPTPRPTDRQMRAKAHPTI